MEQNVMTALENEVEQKQDPDGQEDTFQNCFHCLSSEKIKPDSFSAAVESSC
jgi:hypothetical protein